MVRAKNATIKPMRFRQAGSGCLLGTTGLASAGLASADAAVDLCFGFRFDMDGLDSDSCDLDYQEWV